MKINVDGFEVDLLLGADPEVFVAKGSQLVSAHGLVPGNKDTPFPTPKGAIQVDGMALEFNINPAHTKQEFFENINHTFQELKSRLPSGHDIKIQSTAEFGKAYIDSQPMEAKELGCSPDYNAYTGSTNPRPNVDTPFRTAAGHVHIGWTSHMSISDPEFLQVCHKVIKLMDLFLGVPSVLLDDDTKRRSLYGAAGAFRPKSYGAEYRVLSNFWLKSKELTDWVYDQTVLVIKHVMQGTEVPDVQAVINNSDKEAARKFINDFGIQMPKGFV